MTDDLYPVEIKITNLYCFKGRHTVKLDQTVYAVLAQAEDNPARSNWLGKSTFLMSFAFALFGWHTKRTDDEVITTGENGACVVLTLNDGTVITRKKLHGKSMQIQFLASGAKVVTQASAQEAIEKHIGFTKDDFFATMFYEQKKIGALISAGAAERSAIIEGWLAEELEPIQRLHAAATTHHRQASEELRGLEEENTMLLSQYGDVSEMPDVDIAKANLDKANREVEKQRQLEARASEWVLKLDQVKWFNELVDEGKKERAELDAIPNDNEELHNKAEAHVIRLKEKVEDAYARVHLLQEGDYDFDGVCPITCQSCPASDWVENQVSSPEAIKEAEGELVELRQCLKSATTKSATFRMATKRRNAIDLNLVMIRTKAESLLDVVEEVENSQAPEPASLAESIKAADSAGDIYRDVKSVLNSIEQNKARLAELTHLISEAQEAVEISKDALDLTGRTGAQQAVQELVMGKIEQRANILLSDASIPLQIEISWEQETKGFAKVCSCGIAFPTSTRIRACEACGAKRGPNTQRKLTIAPTRRSGAADDLAGIALGIAASLWLRAQRGSRWATVFIDEPFGALDSHNRQALGAHITQMLKSSYASAFVVAHEKSVLEAMPDRLNIFAGQDGSRISA